MGSRVDFIVALSVSKAWYRYRFTIFAKAVAAPEWEGTSAGDVGAVTHRPVRTKAARGCSNMATHRPVRTAPPKRSPPSGLSYHQAPNLKWVSRATMVSLTVPAFLCTRDDPNSSADSSRIQQSGEHKPASVTRLHR